MCTPRVFPTRSKLFEPASGVHIVRNEGSVPIVNVVVQLIPTGAPRLVSKPSPGNCPSGLGRSRREAEGGQSPRSDSSLWTLPPDLAANGLLRKRAQTRFRGHLAHASANHLKPPYEHWHCAKQAEAHGNGRNRPYQLCKPEGAGSSPARSIPRNYLLAGLFMQTIPMRTTPVRARCERTVDYCQASCVKSSCRPESGDVESRRRPVNRRSRVRVPSLAKKSLQIDIVCGRI
jgi:hypothetical protein